MRFHNDILLRYMCRAPFALAFERTVESRIYQTLILERPILDLGCGEGLFANVVFDEKIDTGIDPNARELHRAKELGGYAELIECPGSAIPKPDGFYRTVFSNSVLEHIPELSPVFKEVHRILVDDGMFYFTVPSEYFQRYSLASRILRILKFSSLALAYERFYNQFWHQLNCFPLEKWVTVVESFGFTVELAYSYNPARNCTLNDALVPFSLPGFIIKRLTNRWILFPGSRSILANFLLRWAERQLKGAERADQGGLVFIAAKKSEVK